MANGRQFDPVAAAALSAINASKRSLNAVQQDVGAPQLPGEQQAAQMSKQGIQTIAQVSPFNVLAKQGLPSPSGAQGGSPLPTPQGGNLPNPQDLLPGQGAQSPLPNPQQFMPQMGGDTPRTNRNKNSGGGGGGGSGSRDARTNRDQSR